jgi:hypothetical protein
VEASRPSRRAFGQTISDQIIVILEAKPEE